MKIYHDGTWNQDELVKLANGEKVDRNGRRFAVCQDCHQVICIDKRLFGSSHFCDVERVEAEFE